MLKVMVVLLIFLCSACATTIPVTDAVSGRSLQTLSSSVSLTLHSTEQSMAGSGYLVFRKPDQAHVVVLSPFGTTLFEAYALGNRITLVYPSEKVAFVGGFDELPEKAGLRGWRSIHWILEDAFLQKNDPKKNGVVERVSVHGSAERITVKNGLIVEKVKPDGEKVYYSKHAPVAGVLLAHELDLRNSKDEQLRIVLDEPEVNGLLEDSAFTPRLDGVKVYPLQALDQQ